MEDRIAFQEKMAAELKECEAQMEQLEARASKGTAEVKIMYYKELERFITKQEAAQERLDELQEANEDQWADTRPDVEKAWQDLRHTVDIAISKLTPVVPA